VTLWPATVTVPVRPVVAAFAPTVSVTVPPPLPLVGLAAIHAAPLVAVQLHPAVVATET
jgi:hypothetical protein